VRAPRINITTAQTTISTASGETIVLGGLITKRRLTVNRRVPFLADVPVLGWMFRYDQFEAQRTELLIILTPHVVRDAADAERLRQIEAARMHWCAADVHEIHGDPAFCKRGDCPICAAQMPVVYPDLDPSGMSPGQVMDMEELGPAETEEGPTMLPEPDDAQGKSDGAQKARKWSLARLLPQREVSKAESAPSGADRGTQIQSLPANPRQAELASPSGS
jgi:hypothetical protein